MFRKLYLKLPKEYLLFGASLLLTLIFIIFFGMAPKQVTSSDVFEIGLTIPKNFVLIPLELQNAGSLSTLITEQGIVDVFEGSRERALVENLRVIKVHNDTGPVFGALVPVAHGGLLQDKFSQKNLRGTLKPNVTAATKIIRQNKGTSPWVVSETPVSEESK